MKSGLINRHILMEQLQKKCLDSDTVDFHRGLLEAQAIVMNLPDENEKTFVEVRLIKDGKDYGTVICDKRRMSLLCKSVSCELARAEGYTWEEVEE